MGEYNSGSAPISAKFAEDIEVYNNHVDYTIRYNHWITRVPFLSEETRFRQQRTDGGKEILWEVWRVVRFFDRVVRQYDYAQSKKEALNKCCWRMMRGHQVKCQMEQEGSKESNQGLVVQDSSKASNTIITRDAGATESVVAIPSDVSQFSSSEPTFQFKDLVGRWMPLETLKVTINDSLGSMIKVYYLPETLFSAVTCAPNLIPYETFFYSRTDVRMKFVVNANKFQCGKVVVSSKYDSYQADAMQASAQAAMNRPHIVLDLSTNNEGTLDIPFKYHRTFIRNVKNDANAVGVRPSKYASVYVQVLSPLRTGKEGATDMFLRPFFMFTNSKFTGMSYRVAVQMDNAGDIVAGMAQDFRQMLVNAERLFTQVGRSQNQDKPTDLRVINVVPRPRMNFGVGRGLSDAQVLRMSPNCLTNYSHVRVDASDPQTVLQIARIWGLRDTFVWKQDMEPNAEIYKMPVDPTMRSYSADYQGVPTPVEYVSSLYNFWSGTLELRFDFVSNAFHTGSVMCSIEFGRPKPSDSNMCAAASTYTKTFHLGEQKSFTITIPYIYDTPWRRSTALIYNPDVELPPSTDTLRNNALSIRPEVKTIVRLSVVNELRPVSTVSKEIDVLVFLRAGPSYIVHGLKQSNLQLTREVSGVAPAIDSFPRDNYKADVPEKTASRRGIRMVGQAHTHWKGTRSKMLPKEVRNEWNEYLPNKIPTKIYTQMDRGEKEDMDPTATFQPGVPALEVQTCDEQWHIKDILRRPVNMIWRHTVASFLDNKYTGFFIPLMPPSREMAYHPNQAGEFTAIIGQTPQAMLMNLFRFWRGSMRYTIMVERFPGEDKNDMEPIYLVHVPHTGVRLIGNQVVGATKEPDRPIFASGLSTEVMIPAINPSITVEVPYDTENNWTLTFEEDAQRNYSWRDKGDTNSGHLVICSPINCQVSVWWSAGDDFAVSNFYGIPEVVTKDWQYCWNDQHARVQMDFHKEEECSTGTAFQKYVRQTTKVVKTVTRPDVLARAAIGSIPYLGVGINVASATLALEDTAQHVNEVGKSANTLIQHVDGIISQVPHQITEQVGPIVDKVKEMMDNVSQNLLQTGAQVLFTGEWLVEIVMDMGTAWVSKSWAVVANSLIKIVVKLLGISICDFVKKSIQELVQCLNGITSSVMVQAPSTKATFTGIICGLVGLAFNIPFTKLNVKDYFKQFTRDLISLKGVTYMNHVLRLISATFDTVKEAVLQALGLVNPEAVALQMLSGHDVVLKKFIESAQQVVNEANTAIMLHPSYRTRFWYTVVQAYQVQKTLMLVPSNVATPQLFKLCQEVIRVGNEKFIDLSCSPVRYEPFVICLEGSCGIGKSHMTDKLIYTLLSEIGYKRNGSGWAYVRAPGSKFWSGYRDQPVVVYDDWLNLNDSELMAQQISELYQLKSTGTFIPEMAHLDEKRIKANPLIVVLLTNGAFPSTMSGVAHHPDAVYRRRDMVLHVSLKEEFRGKNLRNSLTPTQSENLEHLNFQMYKDSTQRSSLMETTRSWLEVKPWLARQFARYHHQEEINVRERMNILKEQLNVNNDNNLEIQDPFSLLYNIGEMPEFIQTYQNAWVPSEQLEMAVVELVEGVRRHQQDPVPIHVPVMDENIFEQLECCIENWSELATAFVKGFVWTPSFMENMLTWSARGLSDICGILNDWASISIEGECVVCMETKSLTWSCNGNHRVCCACWNAVVALSPQVVCPVCRSVDVHNISTPAGGILCTLILWLSKLSKEYFLPALKQVCCTLQKCYDKKVWRVISKLKLLVEVLVGSYSNLGYNKKNISYYVGQIVSQTSLPQHNEQGQDENEDQWYDAIDVREIVTEVVHNPEVIAHAIVPIWDYKNHLREHWNQGDWLRTDSNWWHYDRYGHGVNFRHLNGQEDQYPVVIPSGIVDTERIHQRAHLGQYISFSRASAYAQMDRESDDIDLVWDTEPRVEPRPQIQVELNEDRLRDMFYHPKQGRIPQCCHDFVERYVSTIRYIEIEGEGFWHTVAQVGGIDQFVYVPVEPCISNCYWDTFEKYKHFAEEFFDNQRRYIITQVTRYMNDTRDEFGLRGLPKFAHPSWVMEPVPVPEVVGQPNWWSWLSEKFQRWKGLIVTCGAIVAGISTLWKVMGIGSTLSAQFDPNYNPEHARFLRQPHRNVQRHREVRGSVFPQSESVTDVVENYIGRNSVLIWVYDGDKLVRQLNGIGIYNHYALLPRHYIKFIQCCVEKGYMIKIGPARSCNGDINHEAIKYRYDAMDFISSEVTDISLWQLPASYPMFKDIRKFLVLDKDLETYFNSEGRILIAPTRRNRLFRSVPIDIKGIRPYQEIVDEDNSKYMAMDLLEYDYSEVGVCGSLVLLEQTTRPIIAMHCAGAGEGKNGVGYGVLITQEALGELLSGKVAAQFEDGDFESMLNSKIIFDEGVNVEYLGSLPLDRVPHQPEKSKIEPSKIYKREGLKPYTEPCILSKNDKRYVHQMTPLMAGARKHGFKTEDFPTSWVKSVEEALYEGWILPMKPNVVNPKRLSVEEAILGFDGIPYYDAVSLNTSAGWPYNIGIKKSKSDWICIEREGDKVKSVQIDNQLLADIYRKEQLRRQGIVPNTLFVDTLKDERKLPEKVRKLGGTRVFCASPMDFTIATRQNLLHFCASFMKNRDKVMSGVGINPHGSEWGSLYRRLVGKSCNNVCTLDYSNFGPAFNAKIAQAACNIMKRWTLANVEGVDELELDSLLMECINSTHLCCNTIYRQTCGSPSGAAITVVINTLVNLLYMMVAWQQVCGKVACGEHPDIWQVFRNNVELVAYGDDLIMSVTDKYREIFNPKNITDFFQTYGIVAQDVAKEGSEFVFQPISHARFLKRGFVKHPVRYGEWLAPLEWRSVNDITQWIWSCADKKLATRENCISSFLEAHAWGPKVYKQWKEKVNKALGKAGIQSILMEWDTIDVKFYEEDWNGEYQTLSWE